MNEQTMHKGNSEQFPAHILSFSAQKNNSQQDGASAANADAANRSGATDAVSIISFHGNDQYQSAYACKQARNTMREGGLSVHISPFSMQKQIQTKQGFRGQRGCHTHDPACQNDEGHLSFLR